MVGFNVTCHKLGLWAGKASSEEGLPQEWVSSAGGSLDSRDMAEGRLFLPICFLGFPPSAGLFTLLLLLLLLPLFLCSRRMSSKFFTKPGALGDKTVQKGLVRAGTVHSPKST